MKTRRSLNLLVAAAGLVLLSGCASETLTDSADWSYLPFTARKGGKGTGSPGGADCTKPKETNGPEGGSPARSTPPSPLGPTDPDAEGWNEPAKTSPPTQLKDTTPSGPQKTEGSPPHPATSSPSGPAGTGPQKTSPALPPGADLPAVARPTGASPGLPPAEGDARTRQIRPSSGLPGLEASPATREVGQAPHLGAAPAAKTAGRGPVDNHAQVDWPKSPSHPTRAALHLPELVVEGVPSGIVGKPIVTEHPRRNPSSKASAGLNLPAVVFGEPAARQTDPNTAGLPQALADGAERRPANTTSLPLPRIAVEPAAGSPPAASASGRWPGKAVTNSAQPAVPNVPVPGGPATKTTAGGTLSGGVDVKPWATKSVGAPATLPDLEPSAPPPAAPIPAPFRLSAWISDEALHQAWRRQQSERSQLEPQLRGQEQQRLRLLLDTYLLREKAEDNKAPR